MESCTDCRSRSPPASASSTSGLDQDRLQQEETTLWFTRFCDLLPHSKDWTETVWRQVLIGRRDGCMLQLGLTLTLDGRRMADVIDEGPDEDRHLRTIAAHVSAYIAHVRRQLRHTLPKAIVHCLVRAFRSAPGVSCRRISGHLWRIPHHMPVDGDMLRGGDEEQPRPVRPAGAAAPQRCRATPQLPLPNPEPQTLQVVKAKRDLLDTLHQDVAAREDASLKRLLGEDEQVRMSPSISDAISMPASMHAQSSVLRFCSRCSRCAAADRPATLTHHMSCPVFQIACRLAAAFRSAALLFSSRPACCRGSHRMCSCAHLSSPSGCM